jgi:NlpC/P60 family putative phage cell wall peptidase
MATDIITVARGWIGTPYQHQASLRGVGCDCLGLLRGVWREMHGDEPETVPAYASDWGAGGGETLRDGLARHLAPVALRDMAAGDVALFRMGSRAPARHCGIVGQRGGGLTLIHARQSRVVREEPFSPFWRARLASLFRVPHDFGGAGE